MFTRVFPSTITTAGFSNQTAAIVAPGMPLTLSTYNGCPACASGANKKCLRHDDCTDFCNLDAGTPTCVSCFDGTTQAFLGETDVDCGGSTCSKRCADAGTCAINTDCASNDCLNSVCVSCFNDVKDSDETDKDCGGNHCDARCVKGKECGAHTDCETGWCHKYKIWTITVTRAAGAAAKAGVQVKQASTNAYGILEADISASDVTITVRMGTGAVGDVSPDFDGSGVIVISAANGNTAETSQTTSGATVTTSETPQKTCDVLPPKLFCNDATANHGETDVDCGYACSTEGKLCSSMSSTDAAEACYQGRDCKSGVCHVAGAAGTAGVCTSCSNGAKDGDEADVDCGGSTCTPCVDKKTCNADSDCMSGNCDTTCISCSDGLKNGDETDIGTFFFF
jgi:hypothetical protein